MGQGKAETSGWRIKVNKKRRAVGSMPNPVDLIRWLELPALAAGNCWPDRTEHVQKAMATGYMAARHHKD